jgi:hypothetical protein
MKSTKNLLVTGIALTIALFASVQISAMDMGRRINPQLSAENRELLKQRIRYMESEIKGWQERGNIDVVGQIRNKLNRNRDMLYGNYPYTQKDITDTDKMYQ